MPKITILQLFSEKSHNMAHPNNRSIQRGGKVFSTYVFREILVGDYNESPLYSFLIFLVTIFLNVPLILRLFLH